MPDAAAVAAADAEEAGGKETGKCRRSAPLLQEALLAFKVPLFFAQSLDCTADCNSRLEPIRAGACEESVQDAVRKCTRKKDALVHLKKSLQQGRKDLGRALAARAKMATKASEREEALKSKRGALSAASGKAGKGSSKGVGSSEKPMSLPPIFEASSVHQIDVSWADQTSFFSNTVPVAAEASLNDR